MNEELQREIVNILRAMKDGSPDAFRVLVEQRSIYCCGQAIVAAAGFVVGVMVLWLSSKGTCRHYNPAGPTVGTLLGIAGCIVGVVLTIAGAVHFASFLPEAIAPLGRVLEMMR